MSSWLSCILSLPPACGSTVSEFCGVENCPNGQNLLEQWDESAAAQERDLHPHQLILEIDNRLLPTICTSEINSITHYIATFH